MNRYFIVGTLLCFCCAFPSYGEDYSAKRHKMVEEVLADLAANGNPAPGPDVVQAMEKVERHRFVPDWLTRFAYINRPLPIGHGQTISQPVIVALMTDLIKVKAGDKVLEIGTGSGYQAAVLAKIVKSVYSMEIIESLGKEAAERLAALFKRNISFPNPDSISGNPKAVVEVRVSPSGLIIGSRLVKSSGVPAWDDAVLRAVDKTERIPADNGRYPTVFPAEFGPKD